MRRLLHRPRSSSTAGVLLFVFISFLVGLGMAELGHWLDEHDGSRSILYVLVVTNTQMAMRWVGGRP